MSRPYALMIDPGHGGRDPGAVNQRLQLQEKDIVLSIGIIMRRIVMRGDFLYMPYMTRDDDYYVSLRDRCEKAKTQGVQAFLSIHTNARQCTGRFGLEIESWCYRGSRRGKLFAEIVNDFLIKEINGKFPYFDRGVKEGGFYVLKHTPMPAVLVEVGFLSDNEEAEFLEDEINQRVIASALAEASEYFLEGEPL